MLHSCRASPVGLTVESLQRSLRSSTCMHVRVSMLTAASVALFLTHDDAPLQSLLRRQTARDTASYYRADDPPWTFLFWTSSTIIMATAVSRRAALVTVLALLLRAAAGDDAVTSNVTAAVGEPTAGHRRCQPAQSCAALLHGRTAVIDWHCMLRIGTGECRNVIVIVASFTNSVLKLL